MILIQPTENITLIKSVITDPKLFRLACFEMDPEDYIINNDSKYLSIYDKNVLAGILEYRPLNQITLDCHIFILPQFHKTGRPLEYMQKLRHWFLKNTSYINAFTSVPISCEHVLKFNAKTDWKVCGKITNGVCLYGKLQDLILYSLKI